MFAHLVGNDLAKEYLLRILDKRCIGNSFLFAGPEGIGKSLFAEAFGKEVLCLEDSTGSQRLKIEKGSHPDMHIYKPEGKIGMHTIDAMRQFSQEIYLPPLEAKRKVFILQDAERMLPASANALLKTFEEPSIDSLIILVSSKPSALLTTILSRCRKLFFHALSIDEMIPMLEAKGLTHSQSQQTAVLAQGSLGQALRLLKMENIQRRKKILQVLSENQCEDYKALSLLAQEIAKEVELIREELVSSLREQHKKGFLEKPSASQAASIEKEVEGIVAMREREEAQSVFEIILSWYRDLEVLATGSERKFILNQDYYEELMRARQKGQKIALPNVLTVIESVQLSLERSTGLAICLENLFLKLHLL